MADDKPDNKQQLKAMIDVELLPRAREFAEFAKAQPGKCTECIAKNRRINMCASCLQILFGTAMTEAKLGGPEEFAKKQRALTFKPIDEPGEN